MGHKIELYRGPTRTFFGTINFTPIVRTSMERLLGRDLKGASILVTVLNLPEESVLSGTPKVVNMIPDFSYTYVKIYVQGFLIYQHPHLLSDVITQTLQTKLREKYPEEREWGFRVDIPGIPPVSVHIPHPVVQDGVEVQPLAPGQKPGFSIRRVQESAPPTTTLTELGVSSDEFSSDARVKVVLHPEVHTGLQKKRHFSPKVEEGGFLIGKVFRERDTEDSMLVEITEALTAQYTGASLLHFTFTGDSFAEVKRILRQERSNERVLGWYHTHLFPATDDFGLSSIDLRLHFGTFTIPWQIAGLINLNNVTGSDRTLRFYVRDQNTMVLCPHWVINECNRHSNASH